MLPPLRGLLASLILVALVLVVFARLVAKPGALLVYGDRPRVDNAMRDDARVVGNDLTQMFLPHHTNVAARLAKHGRFPFWDDSGFGGRPMVGNAQGGLFYPPVWLAWRSGFPASLGWLTIAHLAWGGFGVYVLVRGLNASRIASVVAAGCFQASPYVLAQAFEGHYPHVWAACWYPWAFHAFLGSRRGSGQDILALPPILALAFLTGHPQEWYYLVLALSAGTVGLAIRQAWSGRRREAIAATASWAGILALSLGLAAVELLPDLAAQRWALRSGRLELGQASRYHLHALNLAQILGPGALGGPADYFGHDNYWEAVLSIGLVPLVLAGIAVARHPDRQSIRGWAILVVTSLVFAAGWRLGLFAVLYELLPGMDRFRVPSRSLFLATLGASVLAGLGLEALASPATSAEIWRGLERRIRHGAAVVVTLLLLGQAVVGWDDPHGPGPAKPVQADRVVRVSPRRGPDGVNHYALAASRHLHSGPFWLAMTGTLAAFVWARRRPDDRRAVAWSLGILALIELNLHGLSILKVSSPDRFLGSDPISETLLRAERLGPGPFRIRVHDSLYQDLRALRYGFEKVNINDSFQIQHAADLYETLYRMFRRFPSADAGDPLSAAVARFRLEVRQGVLDRMGVSFLVAGHLDPEAPWPLIATGSWAGETYAIHQNTTAMPRAYVVPRAVPAPDDAPTILAMFRRVDPRKAVLMDADPLGPASGPRQPFTAAEWASTDPDQVILRVETEAPGLLVVADTWMPGWTALVDGRTTPIHRGNHAQRVIALPNPGHHEISLRYRPPGLDWGIAITVGSGAVWLSAWLVALRHRAIRRSGLDHPRPEFPAGGTPCGGTLAFTHGEEPRSCVSSAGYMCG